MYMIIWYLDPWVSLVSNNSRDQRVRTMVSGRCDVEEDKKNIPLDDRKRLMQFLKVTSVITVAGTYTSLTDLYVVLCWIGLNIDALRYEFLAEASVTY